MGRGRLLGVAVFGLSNRAFAANDALDLQGGSVGALTAQTLGLAHGLLAFLLVLGLVLELLRGPAQKKQYLAVLWRTLVVLALLQTYTFLAGSVVKLCTSLAHTLARQDASGSPLEHFHSSVAQSFSESAATGAVSPGTAAAAEAESAAQAASPSSVGGLLFDAGVTLLQMVAQAIHWAFTQLSRVLIAFFYAIGPLALVFYVPGLDAPGRWLRSLVTVCCWPLVSSLLLNLCSAVLDRSKLPATGAGAAFEGVASSLLLCILAFATPRIASALVGGAGNLIGEGAAAALRVARGGAAVGAPS
jgi:hypothetical protein